MGWRIDFHGLEDRLAKMVAVVTQFVNGNRDFFFETLNVANQHLKDIQPKSDNDQGLKEDLSKFLWRLNRRTEGFSVDVMTSVSDLAGALDGTAYDLGAILECNSGEHYQWCKSKTVRDKLSKEMPGLSNYAIECADQDLIADILVSDVLKETDVYQHAGIRGRKRAISHSDGEEREERKKGYSREKVRAEERAKEKAKNTMKQKDKKEKRTRQSDDEAEEEQAVTGKGRRPNSDEELIRLPHGFPDSDNQGVRPKKGNAARIEPEIGKRKRKATPALDSSDSDDTSDEDTVRPVKKHSRSSKRTE